MEVGAERILVVFPSWLGDAVIAHSLLQVLKARFQDCVVDVFAASALHPLLESFPEIRACIASPFDHGKLSLFLRYEVGKRLRSNNYTRAYVIPNSIKSSLVPFFAKIPKRIGYCGELRYFLLNDLRFADKQDHVLIERFANLGFDQEKNLRVTELPWPSLKTSKDRIEQTLLKFGLNLAGKRVLAILPGPVGVNHRETKRWPPAAFAEVAKIKQQEGWEVWVLGGKEEQEIAKLIQELSADSVINLVGKTSLSEVVDLLSQVELVLANDTGLMHIASALNRKLVVIYGPTLPKVAPPLTTAAARMVSIDHQCYACGNQDRICPLGKNHCVTGITPDLVLSAINDIS